MERPPPPVFAAVTLLSVLGGLTLLAIVLDLMASAAGVVTEPQGGPTTWSPLFGLSLLALWVARGLWRGRRGFQVMAVLGSLFLLCLGLSPLAYASEIGLVWLYAVVPVGAGIAVAVLVTAPPASRAWFRRGA
ncbi:hypothetical protein Val02_00070 [Virgisporangium aliadipatigenens]|uniref:Uncharacterized protein n=1 Tax=Virgisporangium aliadipatigenens TaxID=741659 RepID=A0A8J4DMT6_9ACTN|nr:hypothetical protein [Virgisporangium aliadipatigenens]GIJ43121.1 hypothetical protein Val02_00070 [Virgisporangium aliadipatigenens]